MNKKLYDIILLSANHSLAMQKSDGSFPCGHNGPWNDVDTHIRTTAHWALTAFKAYDISGEEIFFDAALKACDYLVRKEQRPYGYSFYCRTNETGKNRCNGLIGQAWAMEPLVLIGGRIDKREYLNAARVTALLHPYNVKHHVWQGIEINGKGLGIHHALNQQIWFAALNLITGKILCDHHLYDSALDFFAHLAGLAGYIGERGLIRHRLDVLPSLVRRRAKKVIGGKYRNIADDKRIRLLSEGYLSFVLYGLALAYEHSSEQNFWRDKKLKEIIADAVTFIIDRYPFGCGEKNGYRWCYNPTGLEMAYVLQVFEKYLNMESSQNYISLFLDRQFESYYDFEQNLLCRNTTDPVILSARIYEAVRLKNYKVTVSDSREIFAE